MRDDNKGLRAAKKLAFQQALPEFFRDRRLAELLGERKFLLVDGGAKGGLQKEWLPLMPLLEVIGLEPQWPADVGEHIKAVSDLRSNTACVSATSLAGKKNTYPSATTLFPMALGGEQGVRSFHVTRSPSMSSFLRPDPERTRLYGLEGDAEIRRTGEVETTTLDAIVHDRKLRFVDFVKLDTQGSELEVLGGGAHTIGELAFGLRIETSFVPLYENQPLFADVDTFVRQRGFEFVDFTHPKRYHRVESDLPDSCDWSTGGQLVSADPLYLRAPSSAVAHVEGLAGADRHRYLAGALITCVVYGRVDYAMEVLALARPLIDPRAATVMQDLLHAYPSPHAIGVTGITIPRRSTPSKVWKRLSRLRERHRGEIRSDRHGSGGRGGERRGGEAEERKALGKAERRARVMEAKSAFFQRFDELLRDEKLVLIDGGARGGVPKEWIPAMPLVHVIAVEPRWAPQIRAHGLADEDTHVAADTTFIPMALAAEEGTRSLVVTHGGSMSSFLRPDSERTALYGLDSAAKIVHTAPVETTTLNSIVEDCGLRFVDFVKLNTQGSELEILRGGADAIDRLAFGLRIETCLTSLYEGQPLFCDIDAFVRSHGFEFIDFIHPKRFLRAGPAVARSDGTVRANEASKKRGQLVSEDALYFRAPTGVLAHLETLTLADRDRHAAGAVITCLIYGRFDYAAELLTLARSLVGRQAADLMWELLRTYSGVSRRRNATRA